MWRLTIACCLCSAILQCNGKLCNAIAVQGNVIMQRHDAAIQWRTVAIIWTMQCKPEVCNAMLCNAMLRRAHVHCHLPVAAAMPATKTYRPEQAHERYRIAVPGKQDVINVRVRLQPSTFQYPTPVHEAQQPSQQASVPLGRPRTAKP